jgi:hypothetical protein
MRISPLGLKSDCLSIIRWFTGTRFTMMVAIKPLGLVAYW